MDTVLGATCPFLVYLTGFNFAFGLPYINLEDVPVNTDGSTPCPDNWTLYELEACVFISENEVNYTEADKICKDRHSILVLPGFSFTDHPNLHLNGQYWVGRTINNPPCNAGKFNSGGSIITGEPLGYDCNDPKKYICYMPLWIQYGEYVHYASPPVDRVNSTTAADRCTILDDEKEARLLNWTSTSPLQRENILYSLGNLPHWIIPITGKRCSTLQRNATLVIGSEQEDAELAYICAHDPGPIGCHIETDIHGDKCVHVGHHCQTSSEAVQTCNKRRNGSLLHGEDLADEKFRQLVEFYMIQNETYWVNFTYQDVQLIKSYDINVIEAFMPPSENHTNVITTMVYPHITQSVDDCNVTLPYICQKPLKVQDHTPTTPEPTFGNTCAIKTNPTKTSAIPKVTSSPVSEPFDHSSTFTSFESTSTEERYTVNQNSALPSGDSQNGDEHIAAYIGGGVAACVAVIVVIVIIVVFLVRRKKKSNKESGTFHNAAYNENGTVIHGTPLPNAISDPKTALPAYAAISPASPRGKQELPDDHDYEEPPPVPNKQPDLVIYDNNNVNYSEIRRVSSNDNSGLKISENGLSGGSTSGLDINETVMKDNDVYAGSVRHNANSAVVSNRGYDGYETVMLDNEVYSGSNSDTSKTGLAKGGDVVMKENDLYDDARNDDLKSTDPEDGLVVTENHLCGSNDNVEENKAIEGDGVAKNNEPFYFEVDPKFVKP